MTSSNKLDKSKIILQYITKFERARIIGARSLQLSQGAPSLIDIDDSFDFSPFEMATKEFNARVLPIGINRSFPNKKQVHFTLQKLKDKDFINQIAE